MSVRSSILRSVNDYGDFSTKTYSNISLDYEILDAKKFIEEKDNEMRKRLYDREYTVDKVERIIKLYNKRPEFITVNQIRDIFDDVGFNVDTSFSEYHNGDILMVFNIGGYLIPGWKYIAKLLAGKKKHLLNLYLTKLSPGIKRFHSRIYHNDDGCWYITSHVDASNWMNFLNPIQAFKSHLMKGTGDYKLGTEIMEKVMPLLKKSFEERSNTLFIDIQKIYQESKD